MYQFAKCTFSYFLRAFKFYLRVHFPCEYPQEENTNIGSKRMAHGTNVKIMYSILESYDFIFFSFSKQLLLSQDDTFAIEFLVEYRYFIKHRMSSWLFC